MLTRPIKYAIASVLVLSLSSLMACSGPGAADHVETRIYQPTWKSLDGVPVAPWFDDAKFGIFIHWGPYSVIGHRKGGRGYAEHVPKMIYADPQYYYPWLERKFGGRPPDFGYKDIIELFKAEKWDPDDWATLFQEAGAKYVILTGEHHDGFAMWDSELTDWCATKIGPKRDLVGDLGKACRAKGLKYAPSYHRERHTGFFAVDTYAVHSRPRPDIAEEIRRDPRAVALYGPFSYTDAFIKDYVARWKELQNKYRPDFMWIDDVPIFYKARGDPQAQKFLDAFALMIADYLNDAHRWGKAVYLNNKGGNPNWPVDCGCREKDNLNLPRVGPKWQNPATLGTSYGYMEAEERQDAYKSPTELIQLLCDTVSKNGNLLLNIGPRADGTIPEGMRRRLLAIGDWLNVNGEAIYGTRPWTHYAEGAGKAPKAKPHCIPIRPKEIRYTRKADAIYAMSLNKPRLPLLLTATAGMDQAQLQRVTMLGSNQRVQWQMTDAGIRIDGPVDPRGEHVWVYRIETDRHIVDR